MQTSGMADKPIKEMDQEDIVRMINSIPDECLEGTLTVAVATTRQRKGLDTMVDAMDKVKDQLRPSVVEALNKVIKRCE
jgi:hypothetical protein